MFRGIGLHKLLEHVGLEDPVFQAVGGEVNSFHQLGGSVLQAPRLGLRHSAVEVWTWVLGGILLGAVENLHGFRKLSLGDEIHPFRKRTLQGGLSGLRPSVRKEKGIHHRGTETQRNCESKKTAHFNLMTPTRRHRFKPCFAIPGSSMSLW